MSTYADKLRERYKLANARMEEAARRQAECAKLEEQRRLTRELERKLERGLAQPQAPQPLRPMVVIGNVAAKYGLSTSDILGRSQAHQVIKARHEAIRAVAEAFDKLSSVAIGRIFKRHHTSILNVLNVERQRRVRTTALARYHKSRAERGFFSSYRDYPNKHGYRGVSSRPKTQTFRAEFGRRTIGDYFATSEDAARAYDAVAYAAYGEKAVLNFSIEEARAYQPKPKPTNKCGYIGVSWDPHRKSFSVKIGRRRNVRFVGRFRPVDDSAEAFAAAAKEAALAYDDAARERYGAKARLNFPGVRDDA